jgi:hypothetical protein
MLAFSAMLSRDTTIYFLGASAGAGAAGAAGCAGAASAGFCSAAGAGAGAGALASSFLPHATTPSATIMAARRDFFIFDFSLKLKKGWSCRPRVFPESQRSES